MLARHLSRNARLNNGVLTFEMNLNYCTTAASLQKQIEDRLEKRCVLAFVCELNAV